MKGCNQTQRHLSVARVVEVAVVPLAPCCLGRLCSQVFVDQIGEEHEGLADEAQREAVLHYK